MLCVRGITSPHITSPLLQVRMTADVSKRLLDSMKTDRPIHEVSAMLKMMMAKRKQWRRIDAVTENEMHLHTAQQIALLANTFCRSGSRAGEAESDEAWKSNGGSAAGGGVGDTTEDGERLNDGSMTGTGTGTATATEAEAKTDSGDTPQASSERSSNFLGIPSLDSISESLGKVGLSFSPSHSPSPSKRKNLGGRVCASEWPHLSMGQKEWYRSQWDPQVNNSIQFNSIQFNSIQFNSQIRSLKCHDIHLNKFVHIIIWLFNISP